MKAVEDYINKHIRNNSNANRGWRSRGVSIPTTYTPWLVPNVAREAAQIAREETIKEVCEWIENNVTDYCVINDTYDVKGCIDDLKKHLEDKL